MGVGIVCGKSAIKPRWLPGAVAEYTPTEVKRGIAADENRKKQRPEAEPAASSKQQAASSKARGKRES